MYKRQGQDKQRHQARTPRRQTQLQHRAFSKLVRSGTTEIHHCEMPFGDAVMIFAASGVRIFNLSRAIFSIRGEVAQVCISS